MHSINPINVRIEIYECDFHNSCIIFITVKDMLSPCLDVASFRIFIKKSKFTGKIKLYIKRRVPKVSIKLNEMLSIFLKKCTSIRAMTVKSPI